MMVIHRRLTAEFKIIFCGQGVLNERNNEKFWHRYYWRCALGNAFLPVLSDKKD